MRTAVVTACARSIEYMTSVSAAWGYCFHVFFLCFYSDDCVDNEVLMFRYP